MRCFAALLLFVAGQSLAHQPVMDMAPRWAGGYGVQMRVETFDSETTTWLEGVYTFDRSIRTTVKLPYRDGVAGDVILGLPLKKYFNKGAWTGNLSITPSLQLPTGRDGQWDGGLSLSYSTETPRFYTLYDLYAWRDRRGLDINFGRAFPGERSGMFALWDVSVYSSDDDGDRLQSGPVFVYFRKNMVFRAEYKALVWERDSSWSGGFFNVGIGVVY